MRTVLILLISGLAIFPWVPPAPAVAQRDKRLGTWAKFAESPAIDSGEAT